MTVLLRRHPPSLFAAPPSNRSSRRGLLVAALLAGVLSTLVAAAGIGIRAAEVGAAAVDEPQYLLSAISLAHDGDLDIANQLADGDARAFHQEPLPVQTQVLERGRQVSPHDPLLPVLLAPAVTIAPVFGLSGWVGAKLVLTIISGLVAGVITWLLGTRWNVPPVLAGGTAAVAGTSAPLAVYGHQVYPEIPAALAVLVAVWAVVPAREQTSATSRVPRLVVSSTVGAVIRLAIFVVAISALPWLSVKYALVAAALAAVGLRGIAATDRRLAYLTTGALTVSGVGWLIAHQVIYGGWTAYASGDHFQDTGELSAIGFDPNFLGRSTRLIGLFIDQDYGLAAWQPAWLLVIPALGLLAGLRTAPDNEAQLTEQAPAQTQTVPHLSVLVLPLLAGMFTAVFIALTMHGFWWPGRQLVIVLPLAAMVIAIAVTRVRRARTIALAIGAIGVAGHAYVLIAGYAGDLTWVGAPNVTPPVPILAARSALPNYRDLGVLTWTLHTLWIAVALALLVTGHTIGRRPCSPPGDSR